MRFPISVFLTCYRSLLSLPSPLPSLCNPLVPVSHPGGLIGPCPSYTKSVTLGRSQLLPHASGLSQANAQQALQPPQGPGGGGGGGGPPPGQGEGRPQQQAHPLSEKFVGNAPIIFTGDRSKTEQFLTQWELYWGVNNKNSLMRNAYQRLMLFLTYIQGNIVNKWIMAMSRWLNRQIAGGIHDDNEELWRAVDNAFQRRFANTLALPTP